MESLRRATQSIQTAQRAVNSMRESNDKRDAEIALTHAEEVTALAERIFTSALSIRLDKD